MVDDTFCHLPFTIYHFAMIRILLATLLFIGLQSSNQPPAIETPHLSVKLSNAARAVARGARVSLRVDITPGARMHVYAPGQRDYIPISLTVAKSDQYVAHPAVFPKPETLYFKPLDEMQLVYSKPFRIVQDVTVGRGAHDPVAISGTLRYQACDDSLCYAPRNVAVSWTVPIR